MLIFRKVRTFLSWIIERPRMSLSVLMFFSLSKLNINLQWIGWDTTDAMYINFLFVVDSLKNLYLPAFNHYTLAGVSFMENMVTSNTINFIDITLALIAQIFSPNYVFQLQYTIFGSLSAVWIFETFRKRGFDSSLSFLGAILFSFCLLKPLIGQAPFYYSFIFLSYLLGPFTSLYKSPRISFRIFNLLIALSFMQKAYFFLTILFFITAVLYELYQNGFRNKKSYGGILPFIWLGLLFLVYALPSLFYIKTVTNDLIGNFDSPEPRIRSLTPPIRFYYDSFQQAIIDLFDGRFHMKGKWTTGLNAVFASLFVLRILQIFMIKKVKLSDVILFSTFVASIMFATGTTFFRHLFEMTPLLNSNRWGFGFIHFGQLSALTIGIIALSEMSRVKIKHGCFLFLPLFYFLFLGLNINSDAALISFLGLSFFLFLFFKAPDYCIPFLIILSFTLSFSAGKTFISDDAEWALSTNRVTQIVYSQNARTLGPVNEYEYWDRSSFYKKIPTMNGYNNVVHPIFWYLKNKPISSQIFIPLCSDEILNFNDRMPNEANDNLYLERSAADLIKLAESAKCPEGNVIDIELSPTAMKFRSPSQYTLILHNTSSFIWTEKPLRERVLLGGIRLVEHKPSVRMELRYDYTKIAHYFVYIAALILGLLFYAIERRLKLPKP